MKRYFHLPPCGHVCSLDRNGDSSAAIDSCMVILMLRPCQNHQFEDIYPLPGTRINFNAPPDFVKCIAEPFQGTKTITAVLRSVFLEDGC